MFIVVVFSNDKPVFNLKTVLNQPSLNYITLKRFGSKSTLEENLIKGVKNDYLSLFIFFKRYYKFTGFRKKTQIKSIFVGF